MKKTTVFTPTNDGQIQKTTQLSFGNKHITVSTRRPKTPDLVADVEATTGKRLIQKRRGRR